MASFCLYFVLGAFQLLFLSFGTSGNSSSTGTLSCSTACPSSSVTVGETSTSSFILTTTQGNSVASTTGFQSEAPITTSTSSISATFSLSNTTPTPTPSFISTETQSTPSPTEGAITSTSNTVNLTLEHSTTTSASSSSTVSPSNTTAATSPQPTPSPAATTTTTTTTTTSTSTNNTLNGTLSHNSTTASAPSFSVVVTSPGPADTIASTPATVSPDSTSSSFNGSQSNIVVTPSPTVTGAGASSSSHQFALSQTSSPDSSSVTSTTSGQPTTEVSPTNATAFIPSTSAVFPTTPPKTKSISMKVTLDTEWKEDYKHTNSHAYKELKKNVTKELKNVFNNTEGFVRIEIYSFRKGSVICDFDVVLNESASVKGEDLKKTLQEASKNGLGFKVINIEVKDEKTDEKTKEVLPLWAMVTLILLGALGLVLLITIIILAVLYKRAKESGPLYQVSGDEWAHYESMSMGDYRVRAEQVDRRRLRNGDNNQPVYANHPVSHSNLTYEVPANGE